MHENTRTATGRKPAQPAMPELPGSKTADAVRIIEAFKPAPAQPEFYWSPNTPEAVKRALIAAYESGQRVRIWNGDVKTGIAYTEEGDRCGVVTGGMWVDGDKLSLVLRATAKSAYKALGAASIVRIDLTKGPRLYTHPRFQDGTLGWSVREVLDKDTRRNSHKFEVISACGDIQGKYEDRVRAQHWLDFMRGLRYSK